MQIRLSDRILAKRNALWNTIFAFQAIQFVFIKAWMLSCYTSNDVAEMKWSVLNIASLYPCGYMLYRKPFRPKSSSLSVTLV